MKKNNQLSSCASKTDVDHLLSLICQAILNKKGKNMLVIDVRSICTFTNYFVIAEGGVERHLVALWKEICFALEKEHIVPFRTEGISGGGEWVVLDFGSVLVHLFTHEMRMKYTLEEVWKEGELVDV